MERFPQSMHTAGHQVVHQVVTAGDGIEDVGDPAGLFLLGDGFVAEMGFVVAHGFNGEYRSRR